MPVDLAEAPDRAAHRAVAGDPPPTRPRARHRRPLDVPAVADRWWGRLLALAVAVLAACGPAHAFGHTDLVFHGVLVGLTLGSLAVPLGLVALRRQPSDGADPDAPETDVRAR